MRAKRGKEESVFFPLYESTDFVEGFWLYEDCSSSDATLTKVLSDEMSNACLSDLSNDMLIKATKIVESLGYPLNMVQNLLMWDGYTPALVTLEVQPVLEKMSEIAYLTGLNIWDLDIVVGYNVSASKSIKFDYPVNGKNYSLEIQVRRMKNINPSDIRVVPKNTELLGG